MTCRCILRTGVHSFARPGTEGSLSQACLNRVHRRSNVADCPSCQLHQNAGISTEKCANHDKSSQPRSPHLHPCRCSIGLGHSSLARVVSLTPQCPAKRGILIKRPRPSPSYDKKDGHRQSLLHQSTIEPATRSPRQLETIRTHRRQPGMSKESRQAKALILTRERSRSFANVLPRFTP